MKPILSVAIHDPYGSMSAVGKFCAVVTDYLPVSSLTAQASMLKPPCLKRHALIPILSDVPDSDATHTERASRFIRRCLYPASKVLV